LKLLLKLSTVNINNVPTTFIKIFLNITIEKRRYFRSKLSKKKRKKKKKGTLMLMMCKSKMSLRSLICPPRIIFVNTFLFWQQQLHSLQDSEIYQQTCFHIILDNYMHLLITKIVSQLNYANSTDHGSHNNDKILLVQLTLT
jgi:hypothetical protein